MADLLKPLGLAALVAFAAPAFAQDTAPAPAAEAPAAEAPAADGPGTTYVTEVYDDWQRECLRLPEGAEGEDPCRMAQILYDANKNPVGKIALGKQPAGTQAVASAEIALPVELGVMLPEGLSVGVDEGLTKNYEFYVCLPEGCTARLLFNADDIAAFKAGEVLRLTMMAFLPPERQLARIQIPVSLKGFTKAYDGLATPTAPAPDTPTAPAAQ